MLGEAVSTLMATSLAELDARIRELELERRRVEAELAAAIAVAEARSLHVVDGHRSMKGFLRATCNWSNGEVARFRSSARAIDSHADIGDAWIAGRVGSAQVFELAKQHGNERTSDRFGEFVPTLLDHASSLSYDDFRVVLQRFTLLADEDGSHDDRDSVDGRSAQVAEVGGTLEVRASGGDRLQTAEFTAIFDRFVDAEFQSDRERLAADATFVPRTGRQRRFDALLAMARAAASHEGHITTSEPLVSILIDQQTWSRVITQAGLVTSTSLDGKSIDPFTGLPSTNDLLDELIADPAGLTDRRCETTDGLALHPLDVLRAALSGHVRRVVLDADRRVTDLGRTSRVFTGAARDAARLLVPWCEHPGCDLPAQLCQVDHSTEWSGSGRTDQDNSGIRCGFHNREKHRSKRRVRRIDGRNHTDRIDGTIILPVGADPPTNANSEPIDDMVRQPNCNDGPNGGASESAGVDDPRCVS